MSASVTPTAMAGPPKTSIHATRFHARASCMRVVMPCASGVRRRHHSSEMCMSVRPTRIQSTRLSTSTPRSSSSAPKSVHVSPSQRCQLNTQFIQPICTHQPVRIMAPMPAPYTA